MIAARCRCPDRDRPGHAHHAAAADADADFYDSFKAVDDPHAHRWVIADSPDPSDTARGYEARCERCGLHVVAMVRRDGLALAPVLLVSAYRINGALHVVTAAAREPYAPAKHGRCAPR